MPWQKSWLLLFALMPLCVACSTEKKPPRPESKIDEERRSLQGLYLTADTMQERFAPRHQGISVDADTGELVYPAYTCTAPNCPGKGTETRPFLFIVKDPQLVADDDGTVYRKEPPAGQEDSLPEAVCPECLNTRDQAKESEEDKQKYLDYVVPYEPPETAKRLKELDAESKARSEYVKKRMEGE